MGAEHVRVVGVRPLIGITSGRVFNKNYPNSPAVFGQQYTYINAIIRAGGVPLILPVVSNPEALQRLYEQCDGLLLAGGDDLTASLYGAAASPHIGSTHLERDKQELWLWKRARDDGKAVLGVCRGMQLINIGNGGTLYQDIPTDLPGSEVHRVSPEESHEGDYFTILHQLNIKPGSRLAAIMGTTTIGANGFHHQAVKKLGKDLQATAWAEDGVIEGLEMSAQHFVVAVQSHPEALEAEVLPEWRRLFAAFVAAAKTS